MNETITADKAREAREAAENRLVALQATAEAMAMEQTIRLLESPQPVAVPWSEYPAFDNWGMVQGGFQRPYLWTNPDDYADGRCLPLYENAQDVRRARAESRVLFAQFPAARGLLRKLSNYIIGTGWDFTVKPKERFKNDPAAIKLASVVQGVLDKHLEDNKFVGRLDRELHEQSRIDGESLPTLYMEGDSVRIEPTDPACILEPADKRPLQRMLRTDHKLNNWWHGVHTLYNPNLKRDDAARPLGLHAVFDRLGDQWDYIPARRVEQIKRNVPRLARVGFPDLKFMQMEIEASAKLRRNTAEGAAILAAIVMIREHAEGVGKSSIERMVGDNATSSYQRQGAESARTVFNERVKPGTIKDIPNGMKSMLGPMGTLNSPIYVEVEQHLLRMIASYYSMPEFVYASDASNGTYSSTLVASDPFVKECELEQAQYGDHCVSLHWKALRMHCDSGQLRGYSWDQIRQTLDMEAEYASPASGDKLEQAQGNKILHDAGIISKRTWAADAGYDLDEEMANGAKEAPTPGYDANGAPLVDPNKQPRDADGDGLFGESVSPRLESLAARAIASLTEERELIEGRWITINGGDGDGQPIYIDGDGEITKGPDALVGKRLKPTANHSPSQKQHFRNTTVSLSVNNRVYAMKLGFFDQRELLGDAERFAIERGSTSIQDQDLDRALEKRKASS